MKAWSHGSRVLQSLKVSRVVSSFEGLGAYLAAGVFSQSLYLPWGKQLPREGGGAGAVLWGGFYLDCPPCRDPLLTFLFGWDGSSPLLLESQKGRFFSFCLPSLGFW